MLWKGISPSYSSLASLSLLPGRNAVTSSPPPCTFTLFLPKSQPTKTQPPEAGNQIKLFLFKLWVRCFVLAMGKLANTVDQHPISEPEHSLIR